MTRGKSQAGQAPSPYPSPSRVADRLHSAAIHLLRRVRKPDTLTGIGPAQLSALSVLVFAGPVTLGELARAEQVRPPTMSRIVAGLTRRGLARRKTDPGDRRVVRLQATAKGVRVLQRGRRRRVELLAAAVRRLSSADRATLARAAGLMEVISRKP